MAILSPSDGEFLVKFDRHGLIGLWTPGDYTLTDLPLVQAVIAAVRPLPDPTVRVLPR